MLHLPLRSYHKHAHAKASSPPAKRAASEPVSKNRCAFGFNKFTLLQLLQISCTMLVTVVPLAWSACLLFVLFSERFPCICPVFFARSFCMVGEFDGATITAVPWSHVPCCHDPMIPWSHGPMYHGTMVPWCHGTRVPRYHGTKCRGFMVAWYCTEFFLHGGRA